MKHIPGGMITRRATGSALVALGLATTSFGFLTTGTAVAADNGNENGNGNGNGNNGTIKVQELSGKDVPDNDPHVACSFKIEWRGYEAEDAEGGALQSTLKFTLQNPDLNKGTKFTEAAGPGSLNGDKTALTHVVALDQDPAGGAGDLDASQVYTLAFDQAPANAEQGYHVDVDITVEDSMQGNSTGKQKVFWVAPCAPVPSETVPTETVPTETVPTETVPTETVPTETAPTETDPTVLPTESSLPTETVPTDDSEPTTTPTVAPTSSTAPPEGEESEDTDGGTTPTVLGSQSTAPAVAPTAVDAGLAGDSDQGGVPTGLLVALGAAMALLGLGVGFVPAAARGKHSR